MCEKLVKRKKKKKKRGINDLIIKAKQQPQSFKSSSRAQASDLDGNGRMVTVTEAERTEVLKSMK